MVNSRGADAPVMLRRGTPRDASRLAEIEKKAFAATYYRFHRLSASDFERLISGTHSSVLVATSDRKILGNIVGEFSRDSRYRRVARIDSIAVLPGVQRKGVGRKLASRFFRLARARRFSRVALEVAVPNEGAQALFKSLGFRAQRRLPKYYSGKVDALRMIAVLKPDRRRKPQ